jgi:hypothetical protein
MDKRAKAGMSGFVVRNAQHFGRRARAASLAPVTETSVPLEQQLEEIGAQLDWARGYL